MEDSSRCQGLRFKDLPIAPMDPYAVSFLRSLMHLAIDICDGPPLDGGKLTHSVPSCQKRNLSTIFRRVKILLMLFEEVQDTASLLPPSAILSFRELHVVLQGLKLFLENCIESSRMWLLMQHRSISESFYHLSQNMASALEILPMALMDVSCEVREQVELVQKQARREQIHIDRNESELWSKVQSIMVKIENKEAPQVAKMMEIFTSLELSSALVCQRELQRLQEEEVEAASEGIKFPFNDLASFVRYGKCVLYGATEMSDEGAMEVLEESFHKENAKIPEDYRCPISLELMTDPVIVATGHTYEREAISRWLQEGHRTCPKSGLMMVHTMLIPNHALRNLIWQWNEQHGTCDILSEAVNVNQESQSTPISLEATKLTVEFLVQQLPSATTDMQRHIAAELRLLAKCSSDNRKVIADAGAVPLLIPLLSSRDARTQEHTVTAILNLSIYPPNKEVIVKSGAVDLLIKILCSTNASDVARENSAAALYSLTHVRDYAALLGENIDAIYGLLHLLWQGSLRGRQDAASALFNISVYTENRENLVSAGTVGLLLHLLSPLESGAGLQDEALAVLDVLSGSAEGRNAIVAAAATAIPLLGEMLLMGSPRGKENTVAILLSLSKHAGYSVIKDIINVYSIGRSLHNLLKNGTPRARRKASSLLRILDKCQTITLIANY